MKLENRLHTRFVRDIIPILCSLCFWISSCVCLPLPEGEAVSSLDSITLPAEFSISIYADKVEGARSMAWGSNGTLFVGTKGAGKVYAVTDRDGDFRADRIITIAENLNSPTALHSGTIPSTWVRSTGYCGMTELKRTS